MELQALDVTEKQKVSYCVEPWVADEQRKLACARIAGRIQSPEKLDDEPVAIVAFGPSLRDTWEQIKGFKYIFTCSGAHKFMVERGITPTHHLDVDPRAHKVELMGPPQRGTEYLIASCCHPKLFDHLEGMNVKLWHVFSNDADKTFPELFPRGEWAITGGCSVGLRAMTIARFLGFRNQHIFGLDGSFPKEGSRHAAEHPNRPPKEFVTNVDGKEFFTTPGFMEAARQTFHELDMLKDVNAKFYGEGLVQQMAKSYIRKPGGGGLQNLIAFNCPELISAEYAALNRKLHHDNIAYGVGGGKHAKTVMKLCDSLKTTSVLDFGCGKGYLAKGLPFPIWEFDPAIPEKSATPRPADIVVASDVLEHVEPHKLNIVLDELRRCTKKVGYFVIHTRASTKVLADGRNCHLLQHNPEWWVKKLRKFFTVPDNGVTYRPPLIYVVVGPKPK